MPPAEDARLLSTVELTVTSVETEKAALIYSYTVDSVNHLWAAYDLTRASRGRSAGITTYQEQDLLRAMLVAAASGLDAALKQLIQQSIPTLINSSASVRQEFEKFARRHIQGEDTETAMVSPKVLARILTAPNPQHQLVKDYVYGLTGESLQSADELLRICAALGVASKKVFEDVKSLKEVFNARNQIIHELDMDLDHPKRKRRNRGQEKMREYAEMLLAATAAVIADVEQQVSGPADTPADRSSK